MEIESTPRAAEIRTRLAAIEVESKIAFGDPDDPKRTRWDELFWEKYRLEEELTVEERPFRQRRCFELMAEAGVARAAVEFSGGNDEGGVDAIRLYDADGKEVRSLEGWEETYAKSRGDLVRELERPVDDKYGSFAGDFYVRGTVVWDLAARSCVMDGEEQVSVGHSIFEELTEEV